jgi:hypothetical protein
MGTKRTDQGICGSELGNTHYFYICGIAARYQKRKGSVPDFPLPGSCHNERDNNTHVSVLVHASGHGLAIVDGFGFSRLTLDTSDCPAGWYSVVIVHKSKENSESVFEKSLLARRKCLQV